MKLSLKKCALALILANQLLVVPHALSQIGAQERQDLSPMTIEESFDTAVVGSISAAQALNTAKQNVMVH